MSGYKAVEQVSGNPFSTYIALDPADNLVVVKRFTVIYVGASFRMNLRPSVAGLLPELRKLAEFPSEEGIAPWLRMEEKRDQLYFVRPFYEKRLVDELPHEPIGAPPARLLAAFRALAHGFDRLKQRFPWLSFFVYPDDLYVHNELAVVANWGLDTLRHLIFKGSESHWITVGGSLDAASCYPQAEGCHIGPRVFISPPSISPVFALAALYVYFRIGHGPFITRTAPIGLNTNARIEFWNSHSTAKEYLQGGRVKLPDLLQDDERRILTQALIPNSPVENCTQLINDLSARLL